MKKYILLAGALYVCLFSWAQTNYVPTVADIERFFDTKTLVVLDRNPLNTFDAEIRQAMENEWTVTEFEFIPFAEFEEKRANPEYSFLFLTNVRFEKDKFQATYKFLNLSLGGPQSTNLNMMPDLVSVPVAYKNVDDFSYNYKLGILVRFIQNHILLLQKNPGVAEERRVFKYYNDNIGNIHNRTLYLIEDQLEPAIRSRSRVRDVYEHDFKFVTSDEIREAIARRDTNVVFLHKVGPEGTRISARCYKVLIGAGDANFYYFDYHTIKTPKRPDGLLEKDLKTLNK